MLKTIAKTPVFMLPGASELHRLGWNLRRKTDPKAPIDQKTPNEAPLGPHWGSTSRLNVVPERGMAGGQNDRNSA